MEQDQQSENEHQRRLDEVTEMIKEMHREREFQSEAQRQGVMHEKERNPWHTDCPVSPKSKINSLLPASRVIGASKNFQSFFGNRTRKHACIIPDEVKNSLVEIVKERRQFGFNSERRRQDVEADQAAKAFDSLSLSEPRRNNPSPASNSPPISLISENSPNENPADEDERLVFDNIKRRRMHQHLASVLHARNCKRNKVDPTGKTPCDEPSCSVTSKVLKHIRTCTFVTKCPVAFCSQTREVLHHYKNCKTDNCIICQPAKEESISTREHLIKFMDTICKGLDEEAAVETPIAPNYMIPTVNPAMSLYNFPEVPSLPIILPPIVPGAGLIPTEMSRVNLLSSSWSNRHSGLLPLIPSSIISTPTLQDLTFMRRNMETQTVGTSEESKMEDSDIDT